ncbi:hypothetical protein [Fusibacter ferrireducens]|uniref:Uncharacterized protein n=1 Tax=Fusibacter ferrireducens TaxID=2785058 RepID=A0ABR9ZTH6_9FIRM|nr:hypothetical protein [Fusibacter ferrireducens]MBF4692869.1 hypothetical protein [Fusibacter ferrireducens]
MKKYTLYKFIEELLISDSVYNMLDDHLRDHSQFREALLLRGNHIPISIYTLNEAYSIQYSEVKGE